MTVKTSGNRPSEVRSARKPTFVAVRAARKPSKRETMAKAVVPKRPRTAKRKTVWVVSQLTYPYDSERQEIFNCVFSSFRKAYDFVKREFENDGGKEFDGKSLLDHLFLANEKCEYVLEECEIA